MDALYPPAVKPRTSPPEPEPTTMALSVDDQPMVGESLRRALPAHPGSAFYLCPTQSGARAPAAALDRTGSTGADRSHSKGLYFVRDSDPGLAKKKEEGWFADTIAKLKFWKAEVVVKPEQYRVVVTQADTRSLVTVQDPAGVADKSANGEKILALLKDQLK